MFLKRISYQRRGRGNEYWALMESYRTARGPRQRLVSYLGELRPGERAGWARLAANLDGKAARRVQQLTLFGGAGEPEAVPDQLEIELKGVRVSASRDYGDVFLGLALWRMLELDEFFAREAPAGREEVPWGVMACVLGLARLLEPSSELHIEDTWYRRTALPELLGAGPGPINDTRLYRTLDVVLPLKEQLEAHLRRRVGDLFAPNLEILLYDVTSTYFEGLAERNPQAQRGYSRDHRPDCKQVCIGLVVTQEGFPLGYEVFAGNCADVRTLGEMVGAMERKYGQAQRVWVLDRGIVSEENLAFLRARSGRYVVGTPRAMLKRFEAQLLERDWREVEEGIEVKLVPVPGGQETFVLCRSAARREKEKAMHERFRRRVEGGLRRIARGLEAARKRRGTEALGRQIGRLLAQNSRAARAFEIQVVEDSAQPTGLRLVWQPVAQWDQWAALSEGCYLLRTNLTDRTPEELWRTYIQLTEVESAFRTHKSDLQIRPIWHQHQERVQAHILFSFLAYALWKTLQKWMERSGLGSGARTVVEEFARIKAHDVLLRTTTGREVRVCCITRPDAAQQVLFDHLGLNLPERLGRPSWVPAPVQLAPVM